VTEGPAPAPLLSGTNLQAAGDHNQRVVLHCIRVHAAASKADIARITGLTHAAVTNICRRLLDEGLIVTAGRRRGARGQPATKLEISPEGAFSIGLNVDRDHITMVLVDFVGTVRARRSEEIGFPLPEQVQAIVAGWLPELLAEAGVARARLAGAGVALPDQLGDIQLPGMTADFARWSGFDVGQLFPADFGLPVVLENDAAAAAIGEMHFGFGKRYSSFFYLLVTYGLGGGLVIDSLYRRGANGRSGEIGFLGVRGRGGAVRPLQSIASLSGLYAALEAVGVRKPVPDSEGFSGLGPVAIAAIDAWVERAAEALVEPLVAVACLIDPQAVLVGGRLPAGVIDKLVEATNARLSREAGRMPSVAPLRRAALAEDASAAGAAILLFGDMLMPSDWPPAVRAAAAGT
jgi:predicted NBD/HSP70 family sugar kinase